MTAAMSIIFEGPCRPVMVRTVLPAPAEREVLIEASASLVSAGTERTQLLHAPTYPVLPGYSLVGRVTATGAMVRDLKIGDRVVATVAHASHALVQESFASRIPDGVTDDEAVLFNIGAMAIHSVRLAELTFGDPVLVLGQGLIGLLATQISRQAGAFPVIGVDLSPDRLAKATASGADHVFRADTELDALKAMLRTLPGGGPAATIELTAAAGPIDLAIELTRRQGRVVAASLVPQGYMVDLYGRVFLEGLKLVGTYFNARPFQLRVTESTSPLDWPVRPVAAGAYDGNAIATSAGDVMLFLRLAELGRLQLALLLDDEVPAAGAVAMFERLPNSSSLGRLIRW